MSRKRITVALLKKHNACPEQVAIFRKAWPNGCVPTVENCRKAVRLGLSLEWAANSLLSAPARKAHDEATAPAWKAYDEATAPAWKAYDEAIAPALKAYDEAIAPAWKAYDEACATAFAAAWGTMGDA